MESKLESTYTENKIGPEDKDSLYAHWSNLKLNNFDMMSVICNLLCKAWICHGHQRAMILASQIW